MTGLGDRVILEVRLVFSTTAVVFMFVFLPLKVFIVLPRSMGKVDLESILCIFRPPELSPFLWTFI